MHPSNYTQCNRSRADSRSDGGAHDKADKISCKSAQACSNYLSIETRGIRRSKSGSDVATEGNHHSSVSNELEWDHFPSNSAVKPELQENFDVTPKNSTDVSDSIPIAVAASSIVRRSGSWSGVNESDEDMEQLAYNQITSRHMDSTFYRNSVSSARELGDETFVNSVNGCSCATEDTVGYLHCMAEDKFKRRLKFFFMDPFEKWVAKRRLPWKLLVQIFKILIVTVQLCTFATQRYSHVTYLSDTKITFSHLFIKGWDASREVIAYPPASGPLAIYQVKEFYEFLDYAIKNFFNVEDNAIGAYFFDTNNSAIVLPTLCYSAFKHNKANIAKESFKLNNEIIEYCVEIPAIGRNESWSTKTFLDQKNKSIDFDRLIDATFSFKLKTEKIKVDLPLDSPECYCLHGKILLNNRDQDGQMVVDLDVVALILDYKGPSTSQDSHYRKIQKVLNYLTISICSLSLIMCLRALLRAQQLRRATDRFFFNHFQRHLTFHEKFEFVNLWYILICINDIFIIVGTCLKVELESQNYDGYLDKWNLCSLFLGLGNLLVWFGCLRYLGFFETYNVLMLTMRYCLPSVLRYSSCVLMVFFGYSFCGWLVLGPYHLKFRSLSSTVECLYSLINGDDMFATFTSTTGSYMWWFSRIYLYSFISLFIYVILSLFIAIIMDSYETIKHCYQHGFPYSDLRKFANQCSADPQSGAFHDEDDETVQDWCYRIWCSCCRRSRNGYERIS